MVLSNKKLCVNLQQLEQTRRVRLLLEDIKKRFLHSPSNEISATFHTKGQAVIKRLRLPIQFPISGAIYRHGVGDTVYFGVGMPKASLEIDRISLHAFFYT